MRIYALGEAGAFGRQCGSACASSAGHRLAAAQADEKQIVRLTAPFAHVLGEHRGAGCGDVGMSVFLGFGAANEQIPPAQVYICIAQPADSRLRNPA